MSVSLVLDERTMSGKLPELHLRQPVHRVDLDILVLHGMMLAVIDNCLCVNRW